ncbi:MAG: DUF4157 domain-containing protein [Cyanobacteria bacterium J06632_22]
MGRRDRTFKRKPDYEASSLSNQSTLPPTRPFAASDTETHLTRRAEPRHTFDFNQIAITKGKQPMSTLSTLPVQAKLTIGQPNDKYEQEADTVAQQVVKQLNAPQSQQSEEPVQRQLWPGLISRLPIQHAAPVGPVSEEFEHSLNQAQGEGSTLAPTVQAQMESAMGADFSQVKIHTDAHADQLSRSIQANAFTTGNDVFFKQGAYNPSSSNGQELLAHELTHVIQQNGSGPAISRSLIQPRRERSDAITEAPDLDSFMPVAKLHMHADLDAPGMPILEQLSKGEVGHAWVSLEWNDPDMVPEDLPAAHRKQLVNGRDPFGFWPKKFEWNDYSDLSEEDLAATLTKGANIDYSEWVDEVKSPEFKTRYEAWYGHAPDENDLAEFLKARKDEITKNLAENFQTASQWGGFHSRAADSVGYSQNPFDSYVPGQVLHPDYIHDAKATQTYDLTRNEVNSVLQYAESKQDADYSVFFYNCTTFAKEAVKAAGQKPPKAGVGSVCYPDKLYKSIKSNFDKGRGTTELEVDDIMVRRVGAELESKKKKKK